MTTEGFRRKLTAILSADVEGYSRLMGEDEEATIRTLTSYRELMSTLIHKHRGRVVDSPGDNLLAEFSSVVDAVLCAVEIQEELRVRNAELPENRRMQFRIGINLGDVVEEGDRIYGDGVNITARVEGLAEGGGICISGTCYDHVENKLGLEYKYLGEQKVKNIAKPVRVYRVRMESETAALEITREPELPDKPSIAVLLFVNMSEDPKQEYFSDGITEEIITGLSKVPYLFVIARNSTFTYKGKPVKVQQVAEDLGVRYVLEGSVRKAGDRVRITAQLIDAKTGHHLWSERYDRDLKNIFALQDEITMKIMTALQVKLAEGEQARVYAKGTDNLEAYLKYLEGRKHAHRMNEEDNARARQLIEEAIGLDPQYATPYVILTWTHLLDLFLGSSKTPRSSIEKAVELAKKALALDNSLAGAHGLLGWLYTLRGEHEKAIAEAERAVALEPNMADAYGWLGTALHFVGRYEEAIALLKKAIRLNPIPPTMYFLMLGNAYQLWGMCDESIAVYKKALHREPNNLFAHMRLAATYSLLGREGEARAEAEEVLRIDPKFSLNYFAKTVPYKNQADKELLIDALRKAGLK